jgi:hypothetical protein
MVHTVTNLIKIGQFWKGTHKYHAAFMSQLKKGK